MSIASVVANALDYKYAPMLSQVEDLSCDEMRFFAEQLLLMLPRCSAKLGTYDHKVNPRDGLEVSFVAEELERKYATVDVMVTPAMFHDIAAEGCDRYTAYPDGCTYFLGGSSATVGYDKGKPVGDVLPSDFVSKFHAKHGVRLIMVSKSTEVGHAIAIRSRVTLDATGFSFKVKGEASDEIADFLDVKGNYVVAALNAIPTCYIQFLDKHVADILDFALSWNAPAIYRELLRMVRSRQVALRSTGMVSHDTAMFEAAAAVRRHSDSPSPATLVDNYLIAREKTSVALTPHDLMYTDNQRRSHVAMDYGATTVNPLRVNGSAELYHKPGSDWNDAITLSTPGDVIQTELQSGAKMFTLYANAFSAHQHGACYAYAAELCSAYDYRLVFSDNPMDPYVLLVLGEKREMPLAVPVDILYSYLLRQVVWSYYVIKMAAVYRRYDRYSSIQFEPFAPVGLPKCAALGHEYKCSTNRLLTGAILGDFGIGWRANDAIYVPLRKK
jgi:hypothetical protein